ncbi:protein of unknown function (plasmid) [Caballeronia sp. S22]
MLMQGIAPAVIARTYWDPDEDAHATTPARWNDTSPQCSTRWSRTARPRSPSVRARRSISTGDRCARR